MNQLIKNITIFILLLSAAYSTAQTTMSIEEYGQYKSDNGNLPSALREINDENDFFDPYIGSWTASYNNRDYQVNIYEERYYNEIFNLSEDRLRFSYTIKNSTTGVILADSSNERLGEAEGTKYQPKSGFYELFMHTGCGESKTIFLGFTTSELSLNGQNDDRMVFAAFDSWLNRPATSGRCQSYSHLIPDVAIRFERM